MIKFLADIPMISFPRPWSRPWLHWSRFEGVLGTALELQIKADTRAMALQAEARILGEIERLEQIYSRYKPESELNRWQLAGSATLSPDLAWLLKEAKHWQQLTHGAFNPAAEAIQTLYSHTPHPDPAQLVALRTVLQLPLWKIEGPQAHKLTSLPLNFNALAKGHIADRACAAAFALKGVSDVLVNLGGDLCHRGSQPLKVSIANPFSKADNAPAIARVEVCNQGVATSGHSWRGAHLFDPRTARPTQHISQATVIAKDAATADVLATAFCVLDPKQSLELATGLEVGCLMVDLDGKRYANSYFNLLCKQETL